MKNYSLFLYKACMLLPLLIVTAGLSSCTENYSKGERIGLVVKFSKKGIFWKSHEGQLNITQTGMNTSDEFDFSVDRKNEPPGLVASIDSAANFGWKVKITYHETFGKNWFSHRGETDHFITGLTVLDKSPASLFGDDTHAAPQPARKAPDTVFLVIYKNK